MTYRGIDAPNVGPIVVDLETAPLDDAAAYLDEVTAARNLKDPEKIKADIESRTAERLEKMALDWNVGRIVALGWWTADGGPQIRMCPDQHMEALAIRGFWDAAAHRTVIGFNVKGFDGPYLIQRSRYLEVQHAELDLGRYSKRGVIDLFHELTFNDAQAQACMKRGLKSFCRRFGIPVPDETDGAEIPALVKAGNWDAVRAHCVADVELTVALAQRLGYVAVREAVGAL